jgi:hypothetical protein
MLGHAEEWFYRGLAGIRFDMSGWPLDGIPPISIQPNIVGDLTHASASYNSKLGLIASAWTRDGDKLQMNVTLPALGLIEIPAEFSKEITLDGKPIASINTTRVSGNNPTYQLPAGTYHFESHR